MCSISINTVTLLLDTSHYLQSFVITGGSNQFVVVSLDFSSNTFTCSFLNQLDTTAKLCSISYGFNPQQLTYTANGSSDSFTVTLPLHDDVKRERLVYFIVTASNNTFTLLVEGSQNQNLGKRIDEYHHYHYKEPTLYMYATLAHIVVVLSGLTTLVHGREYH